MQGVKIFNFNNVGPTTVIVGLVHGNEIVGKKSIEYLHKKIKKSNPGGKIITLYANIEGYKIDKRFVDSDLNRSFGDNDSQENYERSRAKEIKDFFENIQIDYMFDLHSTSSKSDPMILCTTQPSSLNLASKMPIKYVVQGVIDIVEGVSLLKYFQKKIKLGMAFECGCHKDVETITKGKEIIDVILDFHQGKTIPNQDNQEKIKITDLFFTSDQNFKFTKAYKGFEMLESGEIRGIDNTGKHCFKESKILVMPNMIIKQELEKKSKVGVAYFGDIIK